MKRLFFPLFAGLLWLMSGTLSATERTYNVLFIQSYTKNTPWHSLLTENLENGLDKGGVKANITTDISECRLLVFRFRVLHHAPHLRACQATENGLDCDLQR